MECFGAVSAEEWHESDAFFTELKGRRRQPAARRVERIGPTADAERVLGGASPQEDPPPTLARMRRSIAPFDYRGKNLARGARGTEVGSLQSHLKTLGFSIVRHDPSGSFGIFTEWAVREFQLYAKAPRVARVTQPLSNPGVWFDLLPGQRYSDMLSGVANTLPYGEPIHGVVTDATVTAIEQWSDRDWRCPVVIEAWLPELLIPAAARRSATRSTEEFKRKPPAHPGPRASAAALQNYRALFGPVSAGATINKVEQNIWFGKDINTQSHRKYTEKYRMFAIDRSGFYTEETEADFQFPSTEHHRPSDPIVLGEYEWNRKTAPNFNKRLTPDTERNTGPKSNSRGHTFWKDVTRIDKASLTGSRSLTDAQRSMFEVIHAVTEKETGGYFDNVNSWDDKTVSLGLFHWAMGDSGSELAAYFALVKQMRPDAHERALKRFGIDVAAWPQVSVNPVSHQRSGRMRWRTGAAGTWADMPEDMAEVEYFRTWHWFHRFIMNLRTNTPLWRGMWDMARLRLRDIHTVRMSGGRTIGQVFTSEMEMALLLRIYGRAPNKIDEIANDAASRKGSRPRAIIAASRALGPKLAGKTPASMVSILTTKSRVLSSSRGSFKPDFTGLP